MKIRRFLVFLAACAGLAGCQTLAGAINPSVSHLFAAKKAIDRNDLSAFKAEIPGWQEREMPLLWIQAAESDRVEFMRSMIDAGYKSNVIPNIWFERAIKTGNVEGIRLMVRSGMNYLAYSREVQGKGGDLCPKGQTMVLCALTRGSIDTLKAFFDDGMVSANLTIDGKPFLIDAVQSGRLDAVEYLIGKGANADVAYNAKAAFDYAVDPRILDLLVKNGGHPYLASRDDLDRKFRFYLDQNPLIARNMAAGMKRVNPSVGSELLGDFFMDASKKGEPADALSSEALALLSYREAAQNGSVSAIEKMAHFFEDGIVVLKNETIADELHFLALSKGSDAARFVLTAKGKLSAPRPILALQSAQIPAATTTPSRRAPEEPQAAPEQAVAATRGFWDNVMSVLDVAAAVYLGVEDAKAASTLKASSVLTPAYLSSTQPSAVPRSSSNYLDRTFTCRPSVGGRSLECSRF